MEFGKMDYGNLEKGEKGSMSEKGQKSDETFEEKVILQKKVIDIYKYQIVPNIEIVLLLLKKLGKKNREEFKRGHGETKIEFVYRSYKHIKGKLDNLKKRRIKK